VTTPVASPSAGPRRFMRLQALDDAIAYRTARLAAPCPDCGPHARCDDHASDADLITAYQATARALVAEIEHARSAAHRASSASRS
jgi:hypothetical protein